MRRTATVHGDRVSFWDSGPAGAAPADEEGEVVLLVHGIAGSAHTWSPMLAELARRRDRRRFVAPDLLGHGSSTAPWADHSLGGYATGLRDLVVALGQSRVTIVGHSLGGGVVQQFAFQFPQYCARLVLVDSGGLGREVSPALRAATLPGAEWVLPVIADRRLVGAAGAVARRLDGVVRHLPGSVREAARSYASLADPDHRRAFLHTARSVIDSGGQRVRATDRLDLADQLPALIAWGTDDTMIPVEHAHRAHGLLPGSELALFDGAGHFPHCDQPAAFVDRLLDFLDRRPPAAWEPGHLAARIAEHTRLDTAPGRTATDDGAGHGG